MSSFLQKSRKAIIQNIELLHRNKYLWDIKLRLNPSNLNDFIKSFKEIVLLTKLQNSFLNVQIINQLSQLLSNFVFRLISIIFMPHKIDYTFQIVLLGDNMVGKTSLFRRFCDQSFQQNTLPTIDTDLSSKDYCDNKKIVRLYFRDTPGNKIFVTSTNSFCLKAHAIIFVYDVNDYDSFNEIVQYWIPYVQSHKLPNRIMIMIGNKSDINENRIDIDLIDKFCTKRGIIHYQFCAKNDYSFNKFLEELRSKLIKVQKSLKTQPIQEIETKNQDEPQPKSSIFFKQFQENTYQLKMEELKYKGKIQQFSRLFQAWDLALSQPFQNVFFIFGQTKSGMTSLAHLLSGNSLESRVENNREIVGACNSLNKQAKIGHSFRSQTQVPNIFPVKLKKKQQLYHIIEGPGNQQNYSFWAVLRKNYLKYRLFSKMKNVKFLLCFNWIQLQSNSLEFVNTIIEWTKFFKDYLEQRIRKQIWKSVAFIVTKVQDGPSLQKEIVDRLREIVIEKRGQSPEQMAFEELIAYVIDNERVFLVKRLREKNLLLPNLLETIDSRVKNWWKGCAGQIGLDSISFNFSQQVIDTITYFPSCHKQLKQFTIYYQTRICEFLNLNSRQLSNHDQCSLPQIINQLANDAMGHPESYNFVDKMSKYINLYQNNFNVEFENERQKMMAQLFSILQEQQSFSFFFASRKNNKNNAQKGKNPIQKLACLRQIECQKNQINSTHVFGSTQIIHFVEEIQKNLYSILKIFSALAFNEKNCQFIHKYGYAVHRFFQQVKVYLLIRSIQSSFAKKLRREQLIGVDIEFFRRFIDSMGISFKFGGKQLSAGQLQVKFVQQTNLDDWKWQPFVTDLSFVVFFCSIRAYQIDQQANQIKLLLTYTDHVIKTSLQQENLRFTKQHDLLIKLIINYRVERYQSYNWSKRQIVLGILKLTEMLAKLFSIFGSQELSKKILETLVFNEQAVNKQAVQKFIQDVKLQGVEMSKKEPERYFECLLKLTQFIEQKRSLNGHEESIQQLQQITKELYEESLKQIKKLLDIIIMNPQKGSNYSYYCCQQFSSELKEAIKKFSQENIYLM